MAWAGIAAVALGLAAGRAQAGPGDLDATFGTSGTAASPAAAPFRSLQSLVASDDGRITGAGPADLISSSIGVVRWLATGAMDTGFGTNGMTVLATTPVEKVRVALDANGRTLVMANRQINATSYAIHVWRLLGNGTLDPAFGTAGQFALATAAGRSGLGYGLAVQPDGKALIGGGSADGLFVLRLTAAGALDATFGTGGTVSSATANQAYRIAALAVQPDGRIACCGWQKDGTSALNPFVLRLTADGNADASFGSNGFNFLFQIGELNALTLRGDGAIVTGGTYSGKAVLAVVGPSGVRDPVFIAANNGRLYNTGDIGAVLGVAVQSNGRIVISGSDTSGTNVRAYSLGILSDGSVDPTFGTDGYNLHDFRQEFNAASQSTVEAVLALRDRRLLVGGVLYGFGYSGGVLQRLEADAALSGIETWRTTHFGSPVNSGTGADAADPDGDRVPNLVEYAFDQNPKDARSHTIPLPTVVNGALSVSFSKPDAAAKKVAVRAEASAALTPGSWQELGDTGAGNTSVFSVPVAGNPTAYLRLLVDQRP